MNRAFTTRPIGGPFGISAELNRLDDVIDYEEGNITLTHGYPRFVPHQAVVQAELEATKRSGQPFGVAFPSPEQAHFVVNDLALRHQRTPPFLLSGEALLLLDTFHPNVVFDTDRKWVSLVRIDGLAVVCLSDEELSRELRTLRRTWGTGFDVHQLMHQSAPTPDGFSQTKLEQRLQRLEGPLAGGACLFQSGMGAIAAVALCAANLGRRFVMIGPSYVDTGTIVERWPQQLPGFNSTWLGEDFTVQQLEQTLEAGPAFIFFEAPTNPRLTLPRIPQIIDTAKRYQALLGVDATIATPFNWTPLEDGFHLVMHSTSKFLGGKCNHLGGVLITRSRSLLDRLNQICANVDLAMCANQQKILFANLDSFEERMRTININAKIVAQRLDALPQVGRVYYPGIHSSEQETLANKYLKPGRSGLLSFLLADDSLEALRKFYDRVGPPVAKGPGLGSEISLMCPYVMLAHYNDDSTFLTQHDLPFHLIRLSVGTEPVEDIWRSIKEAFL